MRLIHDLYHSWLIRAARRDMRSAAFYVGRAEDRLKAAGLELPAREVAVPPVGSRHAVGS
ncbi:hypothetical protein ASF57_17495 [Methylobacterium sp. Leaf117]|nr:hypothetical protein ASF57_17495 [Methylobacterium sp. Leaf117]